MTYTSGPWTIDAEATPDETWIRGGESGQTVIAAVWPQGGDDTDVAPGRDIEGDNARLIAVAPELLAAAIEVMDALEHWGPSIVPHLMDTDENQGQRLRVAIARAESEKG